MKKILMPIFMILTATIFIAAMPTEAECAIYEDTVRLHILANSDSQEDQALKLRLRDEVLKEFGKSLSVFESVDEAENELSEKLNDIKVFADKKLYDFGYGYKTEVTLSKEWYDTREYDGFSLPCGYYTSLRIIIGEGEGKNWLCVMFPPLCLDAAVSTKYTPEEEFLISKKYNVKFKILELISEITR
jgi:stage II sporulation protein R